MNDLSTCPTCGLTYLREYASDKRLHTDFCRRWNEARERLGLAWYDPREYERYKAEYRVAFKDMMRPDNERIDAARRYLHVQWVHRGVWLALRYSGQPKDVPTYADWIARNHATFAQEFSQVELTPSGIPVIESEAQP